MKKLFVIFLLLSGCTTHPYSNQVQPEQTILDFGIRQLGTLATLGSLDGRTVSRDAFHTGGYAVRDAYWVNRNAINQYQLDSNRENMILQKERDINERRWQIEQEYRNRQW